MHAMKCKRQVMLKGDQRGKKPGKILHAEGRKGEKQTKREGGENNGARLLGEPGRTDCRLRGIT